jgi:hypothetical protein
MGWALAVAAVFAVVAVLFVAGALVAMWPDAVEQRRLSARYAAGAAPAGI